LCIGRISVRFLSSPAKKKRAKAGLVRHCRIKLHGIKLNQIGYLGITGNNAESIA
jgi:hypothetical protein